ncbi:hypothetical protein AMAG_01679 [Allomyces macrogynus ATCC 38327]|uniref:Abnormal spindle-like microcephaly-associated protein ASH domain-containing protein n=1 Tax=Allomyces macrogynus (strain ATCC 38327) TaxID=578462 RepID=A0A0L0RZP7_ALLM3|nr:hypothetical protein AMAG_01679 [Allomyces macrogynus ATCC 38327]|eukprot:KNE55808.1 hypothetical protein AMAG_01679 [Allomyces macrogynus ATCC 38327]
MPSSVMAQPAGMASSGSPDTLRDGLDSARAARRPPQAPLASVVAKRLRARPPHALAAIPSQTSGPVTRFADVPTPGAPKPMSRAARKTQLGIDCADVVTFAGWAPCGEYTQHLVLKNASMQTLKLRYRLPSSKVFFMDFPETIALSAGMACSVPITFRPIALTPYRDVVEFTLPLGKFHIPILGTLPEHRLNLPDRLDFGPCAVREPAVVQFDVTNTGEISTRVAFQPANAPNSATPFTFNPPSLQLAPGESITVTATFLPESALAFQASVVCAFGDPPGQETGAKPGKRRMQLHGVGKYAQVVFRHDDKVTTALDVGHCHVGQRSKITLQLVNPSMVMASYSIEPVTSSGAFTFSRTKGQLVGNGGTHEVHVLFQPRMALSGTAVTEVFQLRSPGLCQHNAMQPLALTGWATGPAVHLSATELSLGDVEIGQAVTRVVQLINDSPVAAPFQFDTHATGAFQIEPRAGTVAPMSTLNIAVTFAPAWPINHYRRALCLVEHADPLALHLIGTGFSSGQRPASFLARHLVAFRHRAAIGLAQYGPEQLDHMLKRGDIVVDGAGLLQWAVHASPSPVPPPDQKLVDMDVSALDFGACSPYRYVEPRRVNVYNRTETKVVCVWHPPSTVGNGDGVFRVEPDMRELPPHSASEFVVSYRPQKEDEFHEAQLECFVYAKTMRNFRLVQDATFTPPWCFPLRLVGHTLTNSLCLAMVDLPAKSTVEFPPSSAPATAVSSAANSATKVTFALTNRGDTPALFQLKCPPSAHFRLTPRAGVIPVDGSQLSAVSAVPDLGPSTKMTHTVTCLFNGNLPNAQSLHLVARCSKPTISLFPSGALTLAPTLVGMTGRRSLQLRNESDVAVAFRWQVPRAYAAHLAVVPAAGIVLPRRAAELTATFRPSAAGKFVARVPVMYAPARLGESGAVLRGAEARTTLVVVAAAQVGKLVALEKVVRLPCVLVRTLFVTQRNEIVLGNPTDCDVSYTMRVLIRKDGVERETWVEPDDTIRLLSPVDRIPCRSRKAIRLQLLLREQRDHHLKLQLRLGTRAGADSTDHGVSGTDEWHDLCQVIATGVFPTLAIVETKGSASSSYDLHRSCNVAALNAALRRGMSKKVIDVKLEPQVQGSAETVVQWTLKNVGPVPLKWSMLVPNNPMAGKTQDTAKSPGTTETSGIRLSHRNGALAPGDEQVLTIHCPRKSAGVLEQAVQLQVKSGPGCDGTIPLLISSTTIPTGHGYLWYPSESLSFPECALDVVEPAVRVMRLSNPGTAPIAFTIATEALDEMRKRNGGFPVFECHQPTSTIEPQGAVDVPWSFHPVAATTYTISVPISMDSGNSFVVQVTGTGIEPTPRVGSSTAALVPRIAAPSIPQCCPISLDQSNIRICNLPVQAMVTRLVVLRHHGSTALPLHFEWQALADQDQVRLAPATGVLHPGQSAFVRVFIRGGDTTGCHIHLFECAYSTQPLSAARKLHASGRRISKFGPALPSISSPVLGSTASLSTLNKVELCVDVTTSAHVDPACMVAPRYVPPAEVEPDALALPAARDCALHVLHETLNDVIAQINAENTLQHIRDHAEWHFPDSVAPPQDAMQDVLEGVLFSVLAELQREGLDNSERQT